MINALRKITILQAGDTLFGNLPFGNFYTIFPHPHMSMCKACYWLVIIGALNWGLVGIGGFVGSDLNVVHMIVGAWPQVEWIVYIVVGLAAVCKLVKGGKCSTK